MGRYIALATLFCGALFVVGCAGVFAYQVFWHAPAQRCEDSGRWWWAEGRYCATPVLIEDLTGRPTTPLAPAAQAPAPSRG